MTGGRAHWDRVYGGRADDSLSWFEPDAARSFSAVAAAAEPGDAIVDVGGGVSRLADRVIGAGLGPLSVLDLSAAALDASRRRLGAAAAQVRWIEADATRWTPDRAYRVWHDRAVFHFLTDPGDQDRYFSVMDAALASGGTAVIMTFAEDGPERCSGLSVARWSPDALWAALRRARPGYYARLDSERFIHLTPAGVAQRFQYSRFRKTRAG